MKRLGDALSKALTATLFIAAPWIIFCGNDQSANPSPSSVIRARIFKPDGKTAAAGVTVNVFPAGSTDTMPVATTLTDLHGLYTTPELPEGYYNVWAETDSFSVCQDSIEISASLPSNARDDTLTCGATLTGTIRLYPCHDPRTATVFIPGSGKYAAVNGGSQFTLRNLDSGTYVLLMRSTIPEYSPMTDTVEVASCTDDTMPDTLSPLYTALPMVTNLRARQDTANGIVTLTWDGVRHSSLQDYVVYRDQCTNFNFSEKIVYATRDTFIIDSSGQPEAGDPSTSRCIEYRVAVRTDLQEIGPICRSEKITLMPPYFITTSFVDKVHYPDPDTAIKYASINDHIRIVGYAFNPTRLLTSFVWYDPLKRDTIATFDAHGAATRELYNEIAYSFDTTGRNLLYFIVTDNAGTIWSDTITVNIVPDAPVVNAGNDTGVLTGSTVRLHGKAQQRFGSIVRWEWKIGAGPWLESTGPAFEFIAPLIQTTTVCSLSVTDDDWNRSSDRMLLITSNKASEVAASASHSLILKEDGTALSFGNNEFGQLGTGTYNQQPLPKPVMSDVVAMVAGETYTLFLHRDGTVWQCGRNDFGQFGDGTVNRSPSLIPGLTGVAAIAAGKAHSLFLKSDSTVWACGWNAFGQLGDGTRTDHQIPVPILSGVKSIAAGAFHTLFLKNDGSAWACGENGGGQLGDGTTDDRVTPVKVFDDVQRIAAGSWHSFFLKTDGSLWACGNNGYGQLGDGTTQRRPAPVLVMPGVRSMATAMYHSIILKNDGTLLVCGRNPSQADSGIAVNPYLPFPVMTGVNTMAAGWLYSLILKTDGTVWACGSNDYSQLGDGTKTTRLNPVCIHPPQRSEGEYTP